jgi:hypothetical protein
MWWCREEQEDNNNGNLTKHLQIELTLGAKETSTITQMQSQRCPTLAPMEEVSGHHQHQLLSEAKPV